MKKTSIMYIIIVALIFSGGGFFGGMKYQQTKKPGMNGVFPGGVRPSGAPGNQQGQSGNFIVGQVTSKDDKSVTIKTQDGSSKIVYFSDSTTISKSEKGTGGDLAVGQNINANGKANSDGSVAADNIQIR